MPSHRTLDGSAIRPTPKAADMPATFPKGRRCIIEGCPTTLNIYHDSDRCYAHESKRYRWVDTTEELRELMEEAA